MDARTRENLLTAMHGEAFAQAKYRLFAEHARTNGHPEIGDLFERTGTQERDEHFAELAELVGLVGNVEDNLLDAIAGESYEVDTMYREFAEQARQAGNAAAADRFEELRRDETKHRDAFRAAMRALRDAMAKR